MVVYSNAPWARFTERRSHRGTTVSRTDPPRQVKSPNRPGHLHRKTFETTDTQQQRTTSQRTHQLQEDIRHYMGPYSHHRASCRFDNKRHRCSSAAARGSHGARKTMKVHSPSCAVGNNWNNCRRRIVHHTSVAGTVEQREPRSKQFIVGLLELRKANARSIYLNTVFVWEDLRRFLIERTSLKTITSWFLESASMRINRPQVKLCC